MNDDIIITGHEGLIGRYLRSVLRISGFNILYSIDTRSGFNINELKGLKLNREEEPVDTFVHLAAHCKINQAIEEPELPFENNVRGMHEVMKFIRKNKIKKIIFTSSTRVLKKEKNPYTASKIYGEELVKAYQKCYGIDYVIIRPSTVYGPGQDLTNRLMNIWILAGLRNEELPLYGNKRKTLDFTYISDFSNGFMLALYEKNKEFNISGEQETKLVDLADLIIKETSGGHLKFHQPEIAQPQKVKINTSAIKKLGYKPKVSLEEGVKKVVDWYKNHEEVWR